MSYTTVNNPSANPAYAFEGVQVGNPNLQQSYVFANLSKPDISDYITYRFPQYSLTSLLGRIGRKDPVVGQTSFSWFEKGKFRQSYIVGVGSSALTTATATVKLLTNTVKDCGLLVDDVIRFENEEFGQVTAIVQNAGAVDLTVIKAGAGNFDLAAGQAFAHLYNAKKEFSDSPSGRTWKEEQLTGKVAIMRRSIICSTTEASSIKWIKGPNGQDSYYFVNEMETMEQFAMDRELYILTGKDFGTLSTTASQSGDGIIPRVLADGVVGTYTSTIDETDLQEQIRLMCVNNSGKEFTVLCGSRAFADIQNALRPYILNGATQVGSIAGGDVIKLEIQQYQFMGKVINLQLYYPFMDTSLFPTPLIAGTNYDRVALFLNMGNDSKGNPLINLRYQQDLLGNSLEFRRTVQDGITSPEAGAGAQRSNGKDGFTVDLYASIGVQLRAANSHGMLFAAA